LGIEKLTDKQDKQDKIVGMFDDIASTYDLANRVLSFGIDIQWRKKGCDKAFEILGILGQKELAQVTDVATGTGDLLIYWKEQAQKNGVSIQKYVGVDPSVGMLEVAKKKVDLKKVLPKIGGFISKNYEAYQYLPESIEEFLTTEMLAQELEEAGFEMKYTKSFSMGISTLLVAQKK